MSDQTGIVAMPNTYNLTQIQEAFEEFTGKSRLRTPKHFTTGPQTFAGGSDIASFDTAAGSITANLPASPVDGDTYEVLKKVAGNSLTIGRNGNTINWVAADLVITAALGWAILTWSAAANTWLMRN